jgi:hypothetical protein
MGVLLAGRETAYDVAARVAISAQRKRLVIRHSSIWQQLIMAGSFLERVLMGILQGGVKQVGAEETDAKRGVIEIWPEKNQYRLMRT